jgi:plastocyanin
MPVRRGTRTRRLGAIALAGTLALLAVVLALSVGVASAGSDPVKASDFRFKPGTITIQKGQTVTWKRVNGRHTVTLKNGSFDKILSKGHPTRSLRLTKRGTFRYFCRFHRSLGMKGKVVIR